MFPNYREFYPKSFIPMGEKDRTTLFKAFSKEKEKLLLVTHWLVALEGSPIHKDSEIYHWKVVVYPSNVEKVFYYEYPHFISSPIHSFHDAMSSAKEIEAQIKADEFLPKRQEQFKMV